ncbi:MAG: winged helix-turn-helix transcriptional regulator [Candidatus Yanofskybacteria bacterium]|nr:winged helix-turn-helix transcriptional regulator [Candidatus Yanofskybacteria bacterium]
MSLGPVLTGPGSRRKAPRDEIALGQTARKNTNREKVLALLRGKGELSNSEIREALGVVRRSVARYMTELEKERKVEQVGKTGRGVIYRVK